MVIPSPYSDGGRPGGRHASILDDPPLREPHPFPAILSPASPAVWTLSTLPLCPNFSGSFMPGRRHRLPVPCRRRTSSSVSGRQSLAVSCRFRQGCTGLESPIAPRAAAGTHLPRIRRSRMNRSRISFGTGIAPSGQAASSAAIPRRRTPFTQKSRRTSCRRTTSRAAALSFFRKGNHVIGGVEDQLLFRPENGAAPSPRDCGPSGARQISLNLTRCFSSMIWKMASR